MMHPPSAQRSIFFPHTVSPAANLEPSGTASMASAAETLAKAKAEDCERGRGRRGGGRAWGGPGSGGVAQARASCVVSFN